MKDVMGAAINCVALVLGFFTTGEVVREVGQLHDGSGNLAKDLAILGVLALVLWLNRHGTGGEKPQKPAEEKA